MTDRELMQQALDALEKLNKDGWILADFEDEVYASIEALRARLAQSEQEPVAWITGGGKGELWWHQSVKFDVDGNLIGENPDDIPLYTAPPQREWQTLTENEIKHLWYEACQTNLELTSQLIVHLARNIEAKLKEKNT